MHQTYPVIIILDYECVSDVDCKPEDSVAAQAQEILNLYKTMLIVKIKPVILFQVCVEAFHLPVGGRRK